MTSPTYEEQAKLIAELQEQLAHSMPVDPAAKLANLSWQNSAAHWWDQYCGISIRLAAAEKDRASAQSEVAKLRGLLEKAVPHISRSIFNPTNNDDWYGRGMRLQEEIAAALGERSTSEGHIHDASCEVLPHGPGITSEGEGS